MEFKTCIGIKKWLQAQTKVSIVDVHKLSNKIVIIYEYNGKTTVATVKMLSGVLCWLTANDFVDILKQMNDSVRFL